MFKFRRERKYQKRLSLVFKIQARYVSYKFTCRVVILICRLVSLVCLKLSQKEKTFDLQGILSYSHNLNQGNELGDLSLCVHLFGCCYFDFFGEFMNQTIKYIKSIDFVPHLKNHTYSLQNILKLEKQKEFLKIIHNSITKC